MDTIQHFLDCRRKGMADEAFACLAPGASFGCPWGGMHRGDRCHEVLLEEPKFVMKGYLKDVPLKKIDDRTFQRVFKWDRGMAERGNSGFWGIGSLPLWREVYYIKDDQIRLVTMEKLRKKRSFFALIGLDSRT